MIGIPNNRAWIIRNAIAKLENINPANGYGSTIRKVSRTRELPQLYKGPTPFVGVKAYRVDAELVGGGRQMNCAVQVELHCIVKSSYEDKLEDLVDILYDDCIVAFMQYQDFSINGDEQGPAIKVDHGGMREPTDEPLPDKGVRYFIIDFEVTYRRSYQRRLK